MSKTGAKSILKPNDFIISAQKMVFPQVSGILLTANPVNGNHIALFFVYGKYHRQGIGRKLFEVVFKESTGEKITVNSSPYAVEVYRKLCIILKK